VVRASRTYGSRRPGRGRLPEAALRLEEQVSGRLDQAAPRLSFFERSIVCFVAA
jgi:hypothetical protein